MKKLLFKAFEFFNKHKESFKKYLKFFKEEGLVLPVLFVGFLFVSVIAIAFLGV